MIAFGIVILVASGLVMLLAGLEDEIGLFFLGLAGIIVGATILGSSVDQSSQAHFDTVNHQLSATYGKQLVLTSVYEDEIGFDLKDKDGHLYIHCDGKTVTAPNGALKIADESLTPACREQLDLVAG